MPAIAVRNLSKKFGRKLVFKDVNFVVKRGEKVAIVGVNGSGKTTLLRILSGQIKPSAGYVEIFGKNPYMDVELRKKIGFLSHSSHLYRELTAKENLIFYAKLMGVDESRVSEVLKLVNLWKARNDLVRSFSKGMEQRLKIAKALLNDPDILICDEPSDGLDVRGREFIRNYIKNFNKTVIISTHSEEEIRLCDRVLGFRDGSIVELSR
ncbi:hypothetical protein Asulf_01137 [Archaeoglobus sulfaticallidus PM70-1]|uniref:ABC transporter domain-containing protein n=1 Tax=Archaeoglobus sulfaticallidus PM70-1 TaxID=387631 RepID=N0BFS8_9EURY|nr:ABC transporter ATP-binding protein [Archaeoglobus sulfaticallidus]AGK61137.1 hypothetical protein Asulf_01137 [Archaeoglobus sulfaticallidus PM70-1]